MTGKTAATFYPDSALQRTATRPSTPPHRSRLFDGLHTHDRLLSRSEEPALGSHLVTPRLGFAHHGIYVGCHKVVHYAGIANGLCWGPVEEVSLAQFACGHTLWVRPGAARFDHADVVRRARSRIGEDSYHLFRNNCEHFCEWCLHGEPRSEQVDRVLGLPRWLAHVAMASTAALLSRFGPLRNA